MSHAQLSPTHIESAEAFPASPHAQHAHHVYNPLRHVQKSTEHIEAAGATPNVFRNLSKPNEALPEQLAPAAISCGAPMPEQLGFPVSEELAPATICCGVSSVRTTGACRK